MIKIRENRTIICYPRTRVSQSIKQRSDLQIAWVNRVAFSYYYPQFKYFQATK